MTQLTESQMHDLAARLTRLRVLAKDALEAEIAEGEARARRNDADTSFAVEWAATVRLYGEANAPAWIEFLRGPKPSVEVTE